VTARRRDAAAVGLGRRAARRAAAINQASLGRLAVLLTLALAGCGGGTPPQLTLGQPVLDGTGGTQSARIEMRNDGGRALALHGARLDCGCRLLAPLPEQLAPGEGATLALRCRSEQGARARTVAVLSSDPARPEAVADIAWPAGGTAAGPGLYFGYVALGASAVRDIVLRAGESETAAVASDPALGFEPRPPRADGAHVLRVRFTPRTAGPVHATLTLGGAGREASGVGYRNLIALPAEIHVPSETTGGAPPAIALKAVGTAAVAITAVETPEGLSGEVQPPGPVRELRVVLRAHGPRRGAGSVVLRTNDPDEPVITIPVRDGDA
jgi:hypothetical protein